jgi:hypothetical protein
MTDIAPMSLVIDTRKLDQLSLDGPALRIRMRLKSAMLFPLRRLSRIHIIGAISNGLDALLHCAEQQIPVAFFTVSGRLRCQLYYPVYENTLLSHWIEHVDFDVQAKQVYDDWLQNQMLHELSRIGANQGAREQRYQLVCETLRHLCRKKLGGREFQAAKAWLDGMMNVHLSQLIVDFGLAHQSRGKRRLLADTSPVAELWLMYFLATAVQRSKMRITPQSMTELYQQHSAHIEYTTRKMLTQLASRLESIV